MEEAGEGNVQHPQNTCVDTMPNWAEQLNHGSCLTLDFIMGVIGGRGGAAG